MEEFENKPAEELDNVPDTIEVPAEEATAAEESVVVAAAEEIAVEAAPEETVAVESVPTVSIPEEPEAAYVTVPEPVCEPVCSALAKPKKKRKCPKILKAVLAILLVASLVVGGCVTTAYFVDSYWQSEFLSVYELMGKLTANVNTLNNKIIQLEDQMNATNGGTGNSVSGSPNTSVEGMTPSQVYAKTIQSVVSVQCNVTENGISGVSAGSGFIISEDGYVITNYHVVEGGTDIKVIDCFDNRYSATLVGKDAGNDIAVLKADATGLKPAKIGKSSDLIVGDQVVAIGNALGELSSSLSVGYVSSLDRIVSGDSSLLNTIQADISVNSGNSGGPLLNMKGEVVGIVTIKYSGPTSSGAIIEGIAFAIPTDDIVSKVQDIIDYGYVTGAYLGVSVTEMDREAANYYGLPMGVYVAQVVKGNCAYTAGVREKDIIIGLGDNTITGLNDLTRALQKFEAGDKTTITVWRGGQELVFDIVLDEKPQQ